MSGISYREDFGLWWPDYDLFPEKCHRKVIQQIGAVDCTIRLCNDHDTVVQAGGMCGLWPERLSQSFKLVHTFEPDPTCFEAMRRNIAGISNIVAHAKALGPELKEVLMMPHPSAGGWYVSAEGRVPTVQTTIDSLNLQRCEAIVLDVEAYEAEVLKGARQTIARFRPILHLEVLPRARAAIEGMIAELGYRFHVRIHADEVFVPA